MAEKKPEIKIGYTVQTVATETAEIIVDSEGVQISERQALVKILSSLEELHKKLG